MGRVKRDDIVKFIQENIQNFHQSRIKSLQELKLTKLLVRKNPYLFKAKNVVKAHELVELLLFAHLSSQEEGLFGGFLETLAIYICNKKHGGRKSPAEGIDLEFEREGVTYIVSIKSGPNWGNSGQISKMKDNFKKAQRILRTNSHTKNVIAVNGCCYGKDNKPDKGDYLKLCGQRFWELISDEETLYIDIIKPLGHRAKSKNEKFLKEYGKVVNRFTADFIEDYCSKDGEILWKKIVKENSGKTI